MSGKKQDGRKRMVGALSGIRYPGEPAGSASRILGPLSLGSMGNGDILPADREGGSAVQGYPLPCGAIIATDSGGRVRGVGTPPDQPGPVACSLSCRDQLQGAIESAGEQYERMLGQQCNVLSTMASRTRLIRAIVRLLKGLPDSILQQCDEGVLAEILHEDAELEIRKPGR